MIIESTCRGLFSLAVFLIVVIFRKRKELFLWFIPLLLIFNNAFNTFLACDTLKTDLLDEPDMTWTHDHLIILLIANGTFVFAHWIFTV